MNSNGEGSIEPSEFQNFCIRKYVAEVRKKDWKKCCPFKYFGDSEESNHQAELVLASLMLENNDALDSTTENTEAPNLSGVGISEGQEARSETATEMVINIDETDSIIDRPSDPSSSNVIDDDQTLDAAFTEGAIVAETDVTERNLSQREPKKLRLLSDILKELVGPCDAVSAENIDSVFTTETEDESDDFTLDALIKKKKSVHVTSRCSEALNKKQKTLEVVQPRLDQAKRSQPVSDELVLQTTMKRKKSSAEIKPSSSKFCHENKGASYSMGSEENPFGTQKDSLSLCGHKAIRETVQVDCAREALKLLDGSQGHFIEEENRSIPANGVLNAQKIQPTALRNVQGEPSEAHNLIAPTTVISNKNTGTLPRCAQKRIREKSPPSENEFLVALQLLRLSNTEVHTKTSSMTATQDPALSATNHTSSSRLDGLTQPCMVFEPRVEVRMINGAGGEQTAERGSETSVCLLNRVPADFSIPNAKNKFMRGG